MTANPEPEERLRALAMALRIVAPLINSTPKFSPDGMELLVGDLGDLLDELARLRATLAEAEQRAGKSGPYSGEWDGRDFGGQ